MPRDKNCPSGKIILMQIMRHPMRVAKAFRASAGTLALLAGLRLLGLETVRGADEPPSWQPAAAPLMTRWAAQVSPTNALPEYPRPQLVRPDWLNLNGLWDYAITPSSMVKPPAFEGRILVPFPVESALSGVMRRLDEKSTLWYHRRFAVPRAWSGQRVRLHFGAADWRAQVWVNGKGIGQHRGGYDAFTFDITESLKHAGEEELLVAITDPTDGDQPRGKQSRKPEGIFYTPTSGLWQTVWLEPVPGVCIDDLSLVPDRDASALQLRVGANSLADSVSVEAVALVAGREAGRVSGPANQELRLVIASPHLWSPDDPFLYDLRVTLKEGERVLDTVGSYFGLRQVALRKDAEGITRLALNDQFLFQMGALDQGFWPDGVYTAPTDEALRQALDKYGFDAAFGGGRRDPPRRHGGLRRAVMTGPSAGAGGRRRAADRSGGVVDQAQADDGGDRGPIAHRREAAAADQHQGGDAGGDRAADRQHAAGQGDQPPQRIHGHHQAGVERRGQQQAKSAEIEPDEQDRRRLRRAHHRAGDGQPQEGEGEHGEEHGGGAGGHRP